MGSEEMHSRLENTHDYARFAGDYASLGFDGTYYLAFRDVPDLADKYVRGKTALDYGCGTGRSTRFLKSLGFHTVGVDISVDMLREARQQDALGEYRAVQTAALPFNDSSFDLIFSSFVFIEVPTREEIVAILREMKRALKPDGCILVVTAPADGAKGEWVSFTSDFPENKKPKKSGDTVKTQIRGTDIVLHDYYWSNDDYQSMFHRWS